MGAPVASVGLIGDKRLEKKLNALASGAVRRRMERASLKKALPIGREAVKAAAPVGDTGNLRRSIKSEVRDRIGTVYGIIGADWTFARHAHLVELGSSERFHSSGKSVGRMTPRPFMEPAIKSSQSAMGRALEEELKQQILLEARRG